MLYGRGGIIVNPILAIQGPLDRVSSNGILSDLTMYTAVQFFLWPR